MAVRRRDSRGGQCIPCREMGRLRTHDMTLVCNAFAIWPNDDRHLPATCGRIVLLPTLICFNVRRLTTRALDLLAVNMYPLR